MEVNLCFVSSTKESISLLCKVEPPFDNLIYRVQLQDETGHWITKYWGLKSRCTVQGLGPETLYYLRCGVSRGLGEEELWSPVLRLPTKDGPPMLFYLHKSAERGDLRCLSNFLAERKDSGALDGFDKTGDTALILGVKKNDTAVVRKLLLGGARPDEGSYATNRTPLMHASSLGHIQLATLLIQAGASINATDCIGCNALHYSSEGNHLPMVQFCIEAGVDVNMKDSSGWTPLLRAVILNSEEDIVKELLLNGADLQIKDKNGKTALDHAEINKNEALINLLKSFSLQNCLNSTKVENGLNNQATETNKVDKNSEEPSE